MTALAADVLAFVRRQRLVAGGDRVVVALSGGPDSVALALIVHEILPELGATFVGVAHLHHGLRGADADADEAFSRALAERLGVGYTVDRVDAGAWARHHRVSLELAGHRLRHEFYRRVLAEQQATSMATGHTKNDLAETFLMRAFRGAGLRGLGGIQSSRNGLIRPLLDVTRARVLADLAVRGQVFREDVSNRDTTIVRNRIRHDLLPWLEQTVSPRVVDALARTARLAAADDALLEQVADSNRAVLVRKGDQGSWLVERAALVQLPLALQRRLVCSVLEGLGATPTAAAVDRVLGMVNLVGYSEVILRGVRARAVGESLVFEGFDSRRKPEADATPCSGVDLGTLPIPGRLCLPDGAMLEASIIEAVAVGSSGSVGFEHATFDAGRVDGPLRVRFRLPGDRLQPLGMDGHKKVQDLFVDRKVPRRTRDTVPLVLSPDGQILWVAGHVIAHEARVTSSTTSVLLLQYRR